MLNNVSSKIINVMPLWLKRFSFRAKLFFNSPFLLLHIAKRFHNMQRVAVISFPRSGSSWVGAVLGQGNDVRYLREPITTQFMQKRPERVSVFERESSKDWLEYASYIEALLSGKTVFTNSVIKHPSQWKKPEMPATLVFKEVNPLVVEQFAGKVEQVVYLTRHPFSVAKSYHALGWASDGFIEKKFGEETLSLIKAHEPNLINKSYWYNFGYLLGWIEAYVKTHVSKSNCIIVRYEELCQNAVPQFAKIFKYCNISFNESHKASIERSLAKKDITKPGDFSLTRKQEDVAFVSIANDEKSSYVELMDAYVKGFSDFMVSHRSLSRDLYEPEYQNDSSYVRFI